MEKEAAAVYGAGKVEHGGGSADRSIRILRKEEVPGQTPRHKYIWQYQYQCRRI